MKKRIGAALLALVLTLNLLPMSVLAMETEAQDAAIIVEDETTAPQEAGAETPQQLQDDTIDDRVDIGSIYATIPFSQLPAGINIDDEKPFEYNEETKQAYYNQLDGFSKAIYDGILKSALYNGPTTEKASINLTANLTADVDMTKWYAALAALVYDHPELSWLASNPGWDVDWTGFGDGIIQFYMTDDGVNMAQKNPDWAEQNGKENIFKYANTGNLSDINTKIAAAKSQIGNPATVYDTVLAIHNWVCDNMNYTNQESDKFKNSWRGFQTSYSALVQGDTVCAGYAKSFKLLCDEYNIPCIVAVGVAGGAHAWNYVQVGDAWYAVDCTWDDLNTGWNYTYFLVGSDNFEDHENGSIYYTDCVFAYPELSKTDYVDPNKPDSIEISCDTTADLTLGEYSYFYVPTVSSISDKRTRDITFTAVPIKNGSAMSGQTITWGLGWDTPDGVSMTSNSDGTATLTISNSARISGGYPVTLTALCRGTKVEQNVGVMVLTRVASFIQILKDDNVIGSDSAAGNDVTTAGGSAAYTAKVYDQYGQEMARQTVTWTSSDTSAATVNDGAVTVPDFVTAGTTFTVTATSGNVSATVNITVNNDSAKSLTGADVTLSPASVTYTGTAQTPAVTVKDGSNMLVEGTDYTVTYSDNINAGTGKVTVTGTGNYTGTATATFTINKADPTVAVTPAALYVEAGQTGTFTVTVTGVTGGDTPAGSVSVSSSDTTVATVRGTATVTVTGVKTGDATITVAYPGDTNYNSKEATVTVNVVSADTTITEVEATPFAKTYDGNAVTQAELEAKLTVTTENVEGTWSTEDTLPTNAGTYTVAMMFKPATENYTTATVNISITINKAAVTVTGKTLTIKAGEDIPASLYDVEGLVGSETLDPTPAALCAYTTESEAGEYAITVNGPDTSTDGNYSITYANGTLTVTAADGPTPPVTEKVATPTTSPNGGSFTGSTSVTLSCETSGAAIYYTTDGSTPTASSTRYTEAITLTSTTTIKAIAVKDGMDNSEMLTVTFIRNTSSGGGSTSGGTTPSTTPSTPSTLPVTTETTDKDGTPTTQTTVTPTASTENGEAKSTVNSTLGNEIVNQAVANKSENVVIAPEIKGDVTRTEVTISAATVGQIGTKTNASLTISTPVADVNIPNSALDSLSNAGGNVTVTAEQTGNTVELSVKAGGEAVESISGGVTLMVPAKNITSGTVAVVVHEDGTREVIRKSVADNGSVVIPLDGSAKVEIVDNSKRFDDVPANSWAADAVAFVSSHELFNGTSDTTFSPNLPMSRGMLAVVLHNLENSPGQALTGVFADVDNTKWYAEGVTWAAERGIVTGYGSGKFGPDDDITREQLAVILWRYTGSPSSENSTLHFIDADEVSDWAKGALCWAVENGIINGKGGNILDPKGPATRAETAQMLKYFLENQ